MRLATSLVIVSSFSLTSSFPLHPSYSHHLVWSPFYGFHQEHNSSFGVEKYQITITEKSEKTTQSSLKSELISKMNKILEMTSREAFERNESIRNLLGKISTKNYGLSIRIT